MRFLLGIQTADAAPSWPMLAQVRGAVEPALTRA
jgi:hypothetical protein